MNHLKNIEIKHFPITDTLTENFTISYQFFGRPLHKAPIVLVNHALTGNSTVTGKNGWWNDIIGIGKTIDLSRYTVLAIDVPGNGYNNIAVSANYELLTTHCIAALFWQVIDQLGISQLYATIGGSIGGSIGWEMLLMRPKAMLHFIPIACSIKSSDWLIGNVKVQEHILKHSKNPIEDARMHAMLLYRTPESFQLKFKGQLSEGQYAVESWLLYHGSALKDRFTLSSYKLMNHLLKTIGSQLTSEQIQDFATHCKTNIHVIAINSDYMFTKQEQKAICDMLQQYPVNIHYHELHSVHGHDAFLIETEQLNNLLKPVFQ